jgi:hypothetical protein
MSLFSLSALLENDTAREWLLCRTEDSIQPSTIESAYALKAEVQVDQHLSSLELLVKPVGVVNRVLIGYVLGDPYYFALPRFWGPMVHPACRRFIFDLDTGQFLEFHWYVHNNTVLVNWMKFPTSDHRIRYFILFEAPELDKLPYKLLHSVEIISERTYDEDCFRSVGSFQLPSYVEEELSSVPSFQRTLQSILGIFGGTCRWTSYDPETLEGLVDCIVPYMVTVTSIKFADSLRKRELQRFCHCFTDVKWIHRPGLLFQSNDSLQEKNTVHCDNNDRYSKKECLVCQSRQQSRKALGWTYSWNFVSEEYLFSQEMYSREGTEEAQDEKFISVNTSSDEPLGITSYSSLSSFPVSVGFAFILRFLS